MVSEYRIGEGREHKLERRERQNRSWAVERGRSEDVRLVRNRLT